MPQMVNSLTFKTSEGHKVKIYLYFFNSYNIFNSSMNVSLYGLENFCYLTVLLIDLNME